MIGVNPHRFSKAMTGFFRFILLLIGVSALFIQRSDAHSSLIATYNVQKNSDSEWVLKISMPLGSLHMALLTHHTEQELLPETDRYNETLAIAYLKKYSVITVNDSHDIELDLKSVSLNNHQSNFTFQLENVPSDVEKFKFYVPAMSENIGHVNIARVNGLGKRRKVVLNYKNDFTGSLIFNAESGSVLTGQ